MKKILFLFVLISNVSLSQNSKPELIIGEETKAPGIVFVFEGAIKDHIMPQNMHLMENKTNVHIEARVNWDSENIPKGTPAGGFVPYLHITANVTNQKTGLSTFIDLLPHINLVDNFHYARNISLPGDINELYSVEFNVTAPTHIELALHKDWVDKYGQKVFESFSFSYKDIDFKEIAESSR